MEEPIFDTSNPTLLDATIRMIKVGEKEFNGANTEDSTITEEDYKLIEHGKYADLSLKKQYWINRYYTVGRKAKDKEAVELKKRYDRPASIGEVSAFLFDMISGKGGVREEIDYTMSTMRSYVAILGEALELKGLLTPDDLTAARDSLLAKAKALSPESLKQEEAPVEVKEAVSE